MNEFPMSEELLIWAMAIGGVLGFLFWVLIIWAIVTVVKGRRDNRVRDLEMKVAKLEGIMEGRFETHEKKEEKQ